MGKFKNGTLLTFIILIFIAIFIVFFMWNHMSNANYKTTAEVYKSIETMYGGEITTFKNNGSQYEMELSKNGAIYHIEVEANDGKIAQMKRIDLDGIEKGNLLSEKELQTIVKGNYQGEISRVLLNTGQDTPVYQVQVSEQNSKLNIIVDATTGDILSETKVDAKADHTVISKKEAEKIASEKLNGTIQNTTYFETSNGGYYLVEIAKNKQVETFQIHAVSGKIMSITNPLSSH